VNCLTTVPRVYAKRGGGGAEGRGELTAAVAAFKDYTVVCLLTDNTEAIEWRSKLRTKGSPECKAMALRT